MNKHAVVIVLLASFVILNVTGPTFGDDAKTQPTKAMTAEQLFAKSSPGVVRVITYGENGKAKCFGSGVFISAKGLVVTNYHVVEGGTSFSVVLSSNASFRVSKVMAADPKADLALLDTKADAVPFLRLTDRAPAVGAKVYAIGNPRGLKNTLSEGIVSGFRKSNGVRMLQTTAAIGPGSSGGPLLSDTGEIVGITTFTITKSQNLNFAIPHSRISELIKAPPKLPASQPSSFIPTKHYDSLSAIFAEVPKDIFPDKRAEWTVLQVKLLGKWLEENVGFRGYPKRHSLCDLSISGKFRNAGVEGDLVHVKLLADEIKLLGRRYRLRCLAAVADSSASKLTKFKKGDPLLLKGTIGYINPDYDSSTVGTGNFKRKKVTITIRMFLAECEVARPEKTREPKPKPKSRPKPRQRSPEEQASAKLRLARSYLSMGLKAKARSILAAVIADYSDTPSAKAAKEELANLK